MPTTDPVVAVLDDEPEMRKALRRLLTCRGFRVEEYACGKDLLAALETKPLDYLLLDLHMPGLNGFDVLEAIRSRQTPVSSGCRPRPIQRVISTLSPATKITTH